MHNAIENLTQKTASFGMWLYIMSDCVLFAALFATYAVLHGATAGGVNADDITNLPYVMLETFVLLTSSYTCGLMLLFAQAKRVYYMYAALATTFLLGVTFVALELNEFRTLLLEGNGPTQSAFLSSFFALLGTHGLHVSVGLLWLLVLAYYTYTRGVTEKVQTRMFLFSLFWHFLDIVWIFIFTFVYLLA